MNNKFLGLFMGEKDDRDDLISFVYHTQKEIETCEQYRRDAELSGDPALAEFFSEIQAQNRLRVYRAEQLIEQRIGRQQPTRHYESQNRPIEN